MWQQQLHAAREEWYRINMPAVYADSLMPPPPKYKDDTTNVLTTAILDWCKFNGAHAARVNTTGIPRNIGGKMILTKTKKGRSDIDVIYHGYTIKVEVKCKATGDKISIDQFKEYQRVVKAGGLYFIAEDMPMFLEWWDKMHNVLVTGSYSVQDTPLQPTYERPGGDVNALPTLEDWRKQSKQPAPAKAIGDIIEAHIGPIPSYVKRNPLNHHTQPEINRILQTLQQQGFKVAFRPCLFYCVRPEDKVYKRLPKGYTLQKTPIHGDGLEWEDRVVDKNGAQALEWMINYEDVRLTGGTKIVSFTRRAEIKEQFCIPEFIASENNGAKDGTVYVIDCKRDTNDWKINRYVKILQFILAAKGDTRKVKGGVVQMGSEVVSSIHRVFKIET